MTGKLPGTHKVLVQSLAQKKKKKSLAFGPDKNEVLDSGTGFLISKIGIFNKTGISLLRRCEDLHSDFYL